MESLHFSCTRCGATEPASAPSRQSSRPTQADPTFRAPSLPRTLRTDGGSPSLAPPATATRSGRWTQPERMRRRFLESSPSTVKHRHSQPMAGRLHCRYIPAAGAGARYRRSASMVPIAGRSPHRRSVLRPGPLEATGSLLMRSPTSGARLRPWGPTERRGARCPGPGSQRDTGQAHPTGRQVVRAWSSRCRTPCPAAARSWLCEYGTAAGASSWIPRSGREREPSVILHTRRTGGSSLS
jgi:hypothetical protein